MNVNIQYSKEIISKLNELDIHQDLGGSVMFIILSMAEGKEKLLDFADDASRKRRMLILYILLCRRGLLDKTDEDSKFLYVLSKKGKDFANWLHMTFNDVLEPEDLQSSIEPQITTKVSEIEDKGVVWAIEESKDIPWEQFAEQFVNIFPKSHRCNSKVALIRLERFFKIFPEFKDQKLLICAAKLYVKENMEKDDSLKFMRQSQYFIFKNEGKETIYELANWCSRCQNVTETSDYDLSFLNTA